MRKCCLRLPVEDGYIALLSVLVVGAVSLAIALSLLLSGVDSQRGAYVTQRSAQARQLATACAEEALQQVHDNTAFTGTNNLSLGPGSCTYTVTNTGGSNRAIAVSATVNTVVRRTQLYVILQTSSISITSWQEVI